MAIRIRRNSPVTLAAAALAVLGSLALSGCAPGAAQESAGPAQESAPSVQSISPASGQLAAGATVTITGENLSGVDRVTFGGVGAAAVTVVSDTEVTAVAPVAADYAVGTEAVDVFAGAEAVAPAEGRLAYGREIATPVDAQLSYAFAHWSRENYNLAAYGEFNSVGGDCMNFVSQTLAARGIPQTADWYFTSTSDYSGSWIYTPSFDEYLNANPSLGFTRLSIEQRDQAEVGDLVLFSWSGVGSPDHIQVISDIRVVDGVTKILMVGHNLDSDWRDLDTTITVDHPGAKAWFWKVP
jgi:hypothetical protein